MINLFDSCKRFRYIIFKIPVYYIILYRMFQKKPHKVLHVINFEPLVVRVQNLPVILSMLPYW